MPDDKITIEINQSEIKIKPDSEKLNFLIDSAFSQQKKLDKLNGIPERVITAEKNIISLWGYIKLFFVFILGGIGTFFWRNR